MEFAVNCFSVRVDHFKSVTSVAVHVTEAIRCATIAEKERHLKKYEGNESWKKFQVVKKWWLMMKFQTRKCDCAHYNHYFLQKHKDYGQTWWVVSARKEIKSQNISGSFKWVWGFRFWVWMKEGNCKNKYQPLFTSICMVLKSKNTGY